jgi:hypothetical protein
VRARKTASIGNEYAGIGVDAAILDREEDTHCHRSAVDRLQSSRRRCSGRVMRVTESRRGAGEIRAAVDM